MFPQVALNRDLYLWLIALSAHDCASDLPWLARNQQATLATLQALPGLAGRYQILVEALIAERGDLAKLLPAERAAEEVVRAALRDPATPQVLPPRSEITFSASMPSTSLPIALRFPLHPPRNDTFLSLPSSSLVMRSIF